MNKAEKSIPRLTELIEPILEQHGPKWFKFVLRILGNYADAEDALQEGIRRVLSCDRVFVSTEEARLYMARAISNTAFEIYKLRKRRLTSHVPAQDSLLVAGRQYDPGNFIEHREKEMERDYMLSRLEEAMSMLPVREYEALCLTVLESKGGSIRDTGAICNIAYSTLRHRKVKGLRRLRKYLTRIMRLKTPVQRVV